MAMLGGSSPPGSPLVAKRQSRSWARRIERCCWKTLTLFPLSFVYGVTTWAAYVEAKIGFQQSTTPFVGYSSSFVGIVLYILLNTSYTVAVFTDPGSPLKSAGRGNNRGQYSHLPTTELPEYTSYTVSSSGGARFCKKCHSPKPDRTHHCSSCKRCVLKMDHHCPWLATCVGLHNYKAFILFLIYTSLFCWVCFGTGALWTYYEVLTDSQYMESMMPVNVILMTIIGGIIGLVLTGFTAWHLSLAFRNLTTIEALEKTRYLSPLRKTLDRHRSEHPASGRAPGELGPGDHTFTDRLQDFGNQIIEAHANAIPGVTRAEEGEERPSPSVANRENREPDSYFSSAEQARSRTPAQQSLFQNYGELERQRERERYMEYLDEQDSEKMPNAFDLGWRRNLTHLFGNNPLLWALPVCNTIGDGWYWEASPKFLEARERVQSRRVQEWTNWSSEQQQGRHYNGGVPTDNSYGRGSGMPPRNKPGLATYDRPNTGNTAVSMKTLRPTSRTDIENNLENGGSRDSSPNYDTDSDDESGNDASKRHAQRSARYARGGRSKADRVLGRTPNDLAEEWRDWD